MVTLLTTAETDHCTPRPSHILLKSTIPPPWCPADAHTPDDKTKEFDSHLEKCCIRNLVLEREVNELVERYNLLIDEHEADPSLRIETK